MKPLLFLLAAAAAVTAGCGQQAGPAAGQTADSTADMAVAANTVQTTGLGAGKQCFIKTVGKDSSYLEITALKDSVNGRLEHRRYEKDSNTGEIRGTLQGNIIEVQYRFMSEGVMSTVQAIFKVENGQIYEAFPSGANDEGQPFFDKDPAKIQFDSIPFVKTACK